MGVRSSRAMVRMLESASDPLGTDPMLVVSVLQGAMVGVSRRMLESGATEKQLESLRTELIVMACAYVEARYVRSGADLRRLGGTS